MPLLVEAFTGTFELLAVLGILQTLVATMLVARFAKRPRSNGAALEPVTILKPLYGAEPRLVENLASFLNQDWGAPIQLVCGLHTESDAAFAAVEALKLLRPDDDIISVIDGRVHGANGKVGNLVNMMSAAKHDILILSDSDMAAPRDYVDQVASALRRPGAGAVTCLYRGRGDAGFWSVLGAAGSSYKFLPDVITSLALDAGDVCMGSTIALRRATLERIGGFARFADILADDHAIGAAVRKLGLTVVVPPLVLPHASSDTNLHDLVRHELRWSATIRQLNPAGYAGTITTHPLPFALLALMLAPLTGGALIAATLAARLLLVRQVDRLCGVRTAPIWLLPLRDMLSFLVFLGGFGTGSVDWRGERLKMDRDGRISADAEMVS